MIDLNAIRETLAHHPPRDLVAEGVDGIVIVWETGGQDGLRGAELISLAMISLCFAVRRDIAYFSTAFNRNAFSLHVRFTPEEPCPDR